MYVSKRCERTIRTLGAFVHASVSHTRLPIAYCLFAHYSNFTSSAPQLGNQLHSTEPAGSRPPPFLLPLYRRRVGDTEQEQEGCAVGLGSRFFFFSLLPAVPTARKEVVRMETIKQKLYTPMRLCPGNPDIRTHEVRYARYAARPRPRPGGPQLERPPDAT